MKFEKEDFVCRHGWYYVGHVIPDTEWVDEEQLELILMELNAGVTNTNIIAVPNRNDVVWVPLFDSATNYIHLN
jgi:hypothetical protein